ARSVKVLLALSDVVPAKARRHQILDFELEKLRTRVAEEFLGLRVDQNDLTRAVRNDHRIRSGLQQRETCRRRRERIGLHSPGIRPFPERFPRGSAGGATLGVGRISAMSRTFRFRRRSPSSASWPISTPGAAPTAS